MTELNIEPGQTWEFDRLRPEDAAGVTRLFRDVYGEDYPIRTFVEPERLIEENSALRTVSTVARTPRGDIVGHNAIFHSAASEKIFESGAGLVHRNYRGGKGIFTGMILHGQNIAKEELKASAIWGEPVSNHPFSQKATRALHWVTFAIEVNLMPAAAYAKESSAAGRVSTFMDFLELNPRPHRVFLPAAYAGHLGTLYSKLPCHRDIVVETRKPPNGSACRITHQVFPFAQVSRVTVHTIGTDFDPAFSTAEREVLDEGVEVLQVWLQLTDPLVSWAVDRLRSKGYFFGGLLPRWFDGDGLLMQRTIPPPQWENMHIVFDQARLVKDMARSEWAAVTNGSRAGK